MEEVGERNHEDPVRAFFRTRVGDIGKVLKKVVEVVKVSEKNNASNLNVLLADASHVITVSV